MLSLLGEEDTVERLCHVYSERNAEEPETILFWTKKIDVYCQVDKSITFMPSKLYEAFSANGIIATSFTKCFSIIKQRNDVVRPLDSFKMAPEATPSVLSSALSLVKNAVLGESVSDTYVCMKTLQHVETMVFNVLKSRRDNDCVFLVNSTNPDESAFTLETFLSSTLGSSFDVSTESVVVVVSHLMESGRAVLSEDGTMVRILKLSSVAPPKSIFSSWLALGEPEKKNMSVGDTAVLRLRMSIQQLELRIKALEDKAEGHRRSAIKHKASSSDSLALIQLQMKKNALSSRDKIAQSLLSLTEAYERIDEVEVNVLMTNAFKAAAVGLRSTREKSGLSVDTVEEAMEDFQNEMDEMRDISEVLESGSKLSSEEEEQLEAELAEMMGTLSVEGHGPAAMALPAAPSTAVAQQQGTPVESPLVAVPV